MRSIKAELIVGGFALLVLAILSLMTFRVGGFTLGEPKGYKLYAFFDNTAGLEENTRIKIAGVDAGKVEKIELFAGKARVTLRINEGVDIYSDAVARIKTSGLLGDRFLEIQSGATPPTLKTGNTIKDSRELVDIDKLVQNVTDLSINIADLIAELSRPEIKQAMKESIINIRDVTNELRLTMENTRGPLESTMANLEEFTTALRKDAPTLLADLKTAVAELKEILQNAGPDIQSITQKTERVMDSVNEITEKIKRGEGTLGKLVQDDKLYESVSSAASGLGNTLGKIDRFRTFVSFRGEHLEKEKDGKGHFYVTLQPRKEKYYILGVVSDPVGKVGTTQTTTNGSTFTTQKVTTNIEFTAQFAHRFRDTALRIGMTENTFGLGADQFLFGDRLILTFDAWDFIEDEYLAEDPHLKVGADYFLFRTLFLTGGYDNFLNERKGYYVGAGVRFEDKDLKSLFGALPIP